MQDCVLSEQLQIASEWLSADGTQLTLPVAAIPADSIHLGVREYFFSERSQISKDKRSKMCLALGPA